MHVMSGGGGIIPREQRAAGHAERLTHSPFICPTCGGVLPESERRGRWRRIMASIHSWGNES